jgi:CheY-like chemotaxis protein
MNQQAFIIDDDQICHFLTRHLIKTEGLAQQVTCFFDAEAALRQLLSGLPDQLPDMIFLDLNMPGMNGWQFLDALMGNGAAIHLKTRIFILTSSVDKGDLARSRKYPFISGYFYKPLQSTDLATIRNLLQEASQ